jgi:threonine synthase
MAGSSPAMTTQKAFTSSIEDHTFLRYRALLSPYRLARAWGLSDEAWCDIEGTLDRALIKVDGRGFRLTPMAAQPALAAAFGHHAPLWVKDETGNVGGSHKARHLMGVLLHLKVLEAASQPAGDGLRDRRLAIASCGNAALAAAVLARAADWPLDVFIPPDASPAVVARLTDLGAAITICQRQTGEAGDPCYHAFRRAVAKGAIPFGVQGPDNGLAIEGGRTLAFEMAETFRSADIEIDDLFVQVGGGALASALSQGFAIAVEAGMTSKRPRLMTVQTEGCAPLARAWQRLGDGNLADAVMHRSRFMWPWEDTPASLAHGILDDETYDWWAILDGMKSSDGAAVIANENVIARTHQLALVNTTIPVSATGSAGLAGMMRVASKDRTSAVIFSGIER